MVNGVAIDEKKVRKEISRHVSTIDRLNAAGDVTSSCSRIKFSNGLQLLAQRHQRTTALRHLKDVPHQVSRESNRAHRAR
jgi:bacterioferritin-associated ferredoxin